MNRPSGSAALALVSAATPLHLEPALFDAMLDGWRTQHMARRLSPAFIRKEELTVRRFQDYTCCWPWQWRAEHLEAWIAQGSWAYSTIRAYEGSISMFLGYVCDARYGWAEVCLERLGSVPVQICHERNTAVHVVEYEGRPERRPLSRPELQALFDFADHKIAEAALSRRKGWLAAFRDATLIKVIYAFGLRRAEAAGLDVTDFTPNPAAPELGRFGVCQVRFGKAMRGSPPRRRAIATVMPWVVGVLEQYLDEVRPLNGDAARQAALWLTERGERISVRRIDERFAEWRSEAGLPSELSVHCLRHSYVSHLIEDGVDPLFVQYQAGHSFPSTTALYTTVGADYTNAMLRAALTRAFGKESS